MAANRCSIQRVVERHRHARMRARPHRGQPWRRAGQRVLRAPRQQLLEGDARLEPREALARQKWTPCPKARWRSKRRRMSSGRILELALVPVGGAPEQEELRALRQRLAVELGVARRAAAAAPAPAIAAQHLLDRVRRAARHPPRARAAATACSASSIAPFAIRFVVVSLPATTSTKQKPSSSSCVRRRRRAAASISALIRSSRRARRRSSSRRANSA